MLPASSSLRIGERIQTLEAVEREFPLNERQRIGVAAVREVLKRERLRIEAARGNGLCLICREAQPLVGGLDALDGITLDAIHDAYQALAVTTRIPSQSERWCRACLGLVAGSAAEIAGVWGE